MGGHGYGDVASDIVIDSLVQAPDVGDHSAILVNLLQQANTKIHAKALEYGGGTIGSTVTVMIVDRAIGHIAWVGDSRAYLLRSGSLRMLTRDHTVVQELVDQGVIRTDQAKSHIEANVITRAVGSSDSLDVDMIEVPFVAGDRILLCTDGLTACVSDQLIASLLTSADNPDDACKKLVTAALDRGAPDNISVVVVFIVEA
jgi:protein phosphatase